MSSSDTDTLTDLADTTTTATTPPTSASKKKVSPLIEQRHEWLQQEDKARKRQSIRDEDISRSAAQFLMDGDASNNKSVPLGNENDSHDVSYEGVQNLASRFDNNKSNSEGVVEETSEPLKDHDGPSSSTRSGNGGASFHQPVYVVSDTASQEQDDWATSQSMDLSMDSLDRPNREYWGDARRHVNDPNGGGLTVNLRRHNSDVTIPVDNRTGSSDNRLQPLASIQVADSQFLGFARCGITEEAQVVEFAAQLRLEHPHAAHVAFAYLIPDKNNNSTNNEKNNNNNNNKDGFEEDGEPPNSTGPFLLQQVRESRHEKEGIWLFPEEAGAVGSDPTSGTCVVVVRYFGSQLLGVTCGRLSQCYQRIAQLTLHRLFKGNHIPLLLDFAHSKPTTTTTINNAPGVPKGNLYGLAGGDTELHLNCVQGDRETLMTTFLEQLDFGGFKGAKGEVLPRLQNLQADFYQYDAATNAPVVSMNTGQFIPIYRYPGNYQGDEWETFPWSSKSLQVKEDVESMLPHFYNGQKMNHCVTNFYRHADDYIAHHSDKDLDLDRNAAIVSVSIGAERILELRRRAEPRDLTRLVLPHGSMLLLGPVTNQYFTHSILPAESETHPMTAAGGKLDDNARVSLTLRHVTTYMDTQTGRLFGQGVEIPTLQELRRAQRWDSLYFGLGFGAARQCAQSLAEGKNFLSSLAEAALPLTLTQRAYSGSDDRRSLVKSVAQEIVVGLGAATLAWLSYARIRKMYLQRKEERAARQFFTSRSTSGTKY